MVARWGCKFIILGVICNTYLDSYLKRAKILTGLQMASFNISLPTDLFNDSKTLGQVLRICGGNIDLKK
jgi:hypothetical protein